MAQVKKYWWGVRIRFSHAETKSILTAGAGLAGILAPLPLPALIAQIIAAAIAAALLWIAACDDGNGVLIYITWAGTLWVGNPA